MLRARVSTLSALARRFAASKAPPAAAQPSIVDQIMKAADQDAKRKKGGKGGAPGMRLPYQAMIPLTNIELEDPILPPFATHRRPYPVENALTTTGKPAEYRTIPAFLRTVFTTGSGYYARDQMGLVPITVLGGTPGRKGQNPLHLLVSRRDLELELKEAGVFARMFKFDITAEPNSNADVSAVKAAEQHTIALIRTVDMDPLAHQCQSAVFKRFVPGKPVTVKVPVQFLNANACPGAKKGGILIYVRHAIECKFRGDALPNYEDISVKVDLQNLEVGSRIRLNDVKLSPGLTAAKPQSNVIFVTCKKITAELGATKTEDDAAAA